MQLRVGAGAPDPRSCCRRRVPGPPRRGQPENPLSTHLHAHEVSSRRSCAQTWRYFWFTRRRADAKVPGFRADAPGARILGLRRRSDARVAAEAAACRHDGILGSRSCVLTRDPCSSVHPRRDHFFVATGAATRWFFVEVAACRHCGTFSSCSCVPTRRLSSVRTRQIRRSLVSASVPREGS